MSLAVGGNVVPIKGVPLRLYDSFKNFLAGLGVDGRDKAASQMFSLDVLGQMDLEKAYRGDWLARKIVDIPAFDACRAWRAWQADQDQIEKLEEAERAFGIQRKVMDAMVKARLYGGAAIVLGVKKQKFEDELDIDKVGEGDLAFAHVITKWMIAPGPLVRDITSPWFGEPEYYQRSNTPITGPIGGVAPLETGVFGKEAGSMLNIHPSRVVRIIGNDYPNMEISPDAWGDSVLQTVVDAIKDAGLVGQSIAALTAKANVDVIKIPGLTQMLSTDKGTTALVSRFSQSNAAKSVVNSLLIDSSEEWNQLQASFSGLPQVFQMYLMVACGAADIPATRLLGKAPDGMNSTGDSDLRNYYDKLQSEQKVKMTPTLSRLDEVLIRHVFGKRDKSIHYDWNPLWQMDDVQKSEIALKKAQAYKIDVDAGQISPDALRVGRENQLIEDGTYPGFESALDEAEAAAGEDVPEEAIPPHPAIREQNTAREEAIERFKQTNQQQLKVAAQKPPPFGGKPPVGKPKGNGNGAAKDALADDLAGGGGQSGLSFEVPFGGRRRKRGRPFDEIEYPPVIRVGAIEDWSPDQPRVPAGSSEGGQWGGGGGGGGGGRAEVVPTTSDILNEVEAHLAKQGIPVASLSHFDSALLKATVRLGGELGAASDVLTGHEEMAIKNTFGTVEAAWEQATLYEKEHGGLPSQQAAAAHELEKQTGTATPPPWPKSTGGTSYNIPGVGWEEAGYAEKMWQKLQGELGTGAAGYADNPDYMKQYIKGPALHEVEPAIKKAGLEEAAALETAEAVQEIASKLGAPYGGLYHLGGTDAQNHAATVTWTATHTAHKGIHYRRMMARLLKDAPKFGTSPEVVGIIKTKFTTSLRLTAEGLIDAGKFGEAHKAITTLHNLGASEDVIVPLEAAFNKAQNEPHADKPAVVGPAALSSVTGLAVGDPKTYYQNHLLTAEEKLTHAVNSSYNSEWLIQNLSLAENSALKDKYGSIGAALTSAQAKLALAKAQSETKAAVAKEAANVANAQALALAKVGVTQSDLDKAKKTTGYYPEPQSAEGKALAAVWNAKWSGKDVSGSLGDLSQKVAEYKVTAGQIAALASKEQTAQKAAAEVAAAKAKEEYAKNHAAEIAAAAAAKEKAAAEVAVHMKEIAGLVAELGCSPTDAEAVDALIHLSGKTPKTLVLEFKQAKESGGWKGMPISPFEYGMLASYVGSGYHTVNNGLRAGYWNMQTHVFSAAIQTALKKLPAYDKTLYRGVTLDSSQQQAYAIGHVVEWKAFSSCGKSSHFSGNTQFTITPKGGFRDLGNMNPGECGGEVLGMARTTVKVTKVEGKPGGSMKVWVEEIGF